MEGGIVRVVDILCETSGRTCFGITYQLAGKELKQISFLSVYRVIISNPFRWSFKKQGVRRDSGNVTPYSTYTTMEKENQSYVL